MGIEICDDGESAALRMADWIEQAVSDKPDLCLGLATGRTPARAYEELVRRHYTRPDLSFRKVTTFNTDEFSDVPSEDPRSARYFMNSKLFKLADFRLEHTHVPRGDAPDIQSECKGYECLIKASGGIDLVVLGLGHNGHIGFNEPGSSIKTRTRPVDFTESTMAALSDGTRFKDLDSTPKGAITMGLATILEAKAILLIATGIGKARAVHRMLDCRPGPSMPASQLRDHPNLSMVIDRSAASLLEDPQLDVTTH